MPLYQAAVPVVALLDAPDAQAAIRQLLDMVRRAGLTTNAPGGGQPAGAYATEVPASAQGQPANGWTTAGGGDRWGRGQGTGGGDRWGRGG
jgi:hypothetical protein